MSLKLSVVATSTSIRDGRSARAHTTPDSTDTSPDWTPWVMTGRSSARLRYGRARLSIVVAAVVAAAVTRKRRRVSLAVGMGRALGEQNHIRSGRVPTVGDPVVTLAAPCLA